MKVQREQFLAAALMLAATGAPGCAEYEVRNQAAAPQPVYTAGGAAYQPAPQPVYQTAPQPVYQQPGYPTTEGGGYVASPTYEGGPTPGRPVRPPPAPVYEGGTYVPAPVGE